MRALLLRERTSESPLLIPDCSLEQLPAGEVLIKVTHSGVNYKDALALSATAGIVRQWPMAPGIDLAGVVEESSVSEFGPGQQVLATGYGLGERHWGGYAEYARLPASWLCPLPAGRDARWAMALGTAGLTAMLSIMALEESGALDSGEEPVAVSGAGGGVGGVAVALLHAAGHKVAAITGRAQLADYLHRLGADQIVSRESAAVPPQVLESARWAAAVDTVGGPILARLIAETAYGGAIAISGMAASTDFPGSVIPFILRGLTMLGIESVACPGPKRLRAWKRLAQLLPEEVTDLLVEETITLDALPAAAARVLAGEVRGRLLVDVGA